MEWQTQKECLDKLFTNPNGNVSEIIRIFQNVSNDTNLSTSNEAIQFLNEHSIQLLEPELVETMQNNRLGAYSYLLVANNMLDLEDVKDDLLNGNVLANATPPNTIRKLKSYLDLAPSPPSSTAHEESLATASISTETPAVYQQTKGQKESMPLTIAQPQHYIHHGGTNDNGNRIAIKIKDQCIFLERLGGDMFSHQLDLKETATFTDTSCMIKRFSFGEHKQVVDKTCKTILVMGATGSGKTTWINAMINYVLGVELEDNFRFKLVKEDVKGGSQAHSQTQGVTVYDIHHQNGFRIPFSLTIVDTPGFGDTRGMERDEEITATIKKFFEHENGIQELDAIGFVVKSSDARLTDSQKYIFESVLSIFGMDMGENIRFLVTWAGDGHSPVLAAIKEAQLPCQKDPSGSPCHHKFNNEAVYKHLSSNDVMASCTWKMSMENFESFFHELNGMKTTSLQMTKKVLETRECLEVNLEFMWDGIDRQLTKIEELRKTKEIIDQNREKIDNNQNFEITVEVSKKVKIALGENQSTALNCTKCEVTCHYPCFASLWTISCPAFWDSSSLSAISQKVVASALELFKEAAPVDPVALVTETGINLITTNRTCIVCSGRCPSGDHVNENRRWVYKQVKEKKTLFDVLQQYEDAKGQQATAEGTLTILQEEMEKLKSEILKAMKKITIYSNTLKNIALRGIPLTTTEYLQLKIENEKEEKKCGYEQRIEILEDVLKTANKNLNEGATTFD